MRYKIRVLALSLLLPVAAEAADASAGKVAFDRWCAECHAGGVGHPGAQQLERLRGAKLALLESRTDLEPAFIRYVVRHGQNAMPPYRPSEISDATLDQIARHLGAAGAATPGGRQDRSRAGRDRPAAARAPQ
jgi:mono/diheme cytochrome c family protein